MMRYSLVLSLLVLLVSATTAAAQQDVSALVDRINRLERTINDLQRSVYAGTPPSGGAAVATSDAGVQAALPNLLTKVQQLESQVRQLTGRVEELGYQTQRVGEHVERLQADTDLRLRSLEGGDAPPPNARPPSAAAPATSSPPSAATTLGAPPRPLGQLTQSEIAQAEASRPAVGAQRAALPDGPIEQQYQSAFDHLVRHDYEGAEQSFRAFLERHPTDPLAGNAQYWLGETYYVRQRYEDAAVAFLEGYQKYPKNPKAPDNLLKLGMALGQVGQPAEACATFAKLQQDFPDAPTNVKRRLFQESQRLQCAN